MKHNRTIIYLAGFLFSVPVALTSYINSSFLGTYTDQSNVAIVYIVASVLSILAMLEIERIICRIGNRKMTLLISVLIFLSFIMMAVAKNSLIAIPAFIVNFVAINFMIATLDIFVEDFSKRDSVGRSRGFYLAFLNVAWVMAELISGSIIGKSSFAGIYYFSAGFMVLVSLVVILFLKNFVDPKYKKVAILKTIKYFIHNKHLSKIYLINFILRFFFAWMVIYTPVYLHQYIGLGWDKIGFVFTIMLCAFFLQLPLGRMADKTGEKKALIYGFGICAFFTLLIPFFNFASVLLWASILFGTRVGAAIIEVMSESYFFKVVSEENADAISFFRNTTPLSYIIAPLLAIPILLFVPSFKYLFFVLSAILVVGLFISLRLRDVK